MSTCCHNCIGGGYDILENLYSIIRWNDKGKVVASPKFNSELLMDVVTVGHLNICINEAGCLKMNNLVDFNGIWYTLNNQDIYFFINKFLIMVWKERGWLGSLYKLFLKTMTPLIFQLYGFSFL